jgi:transcriptional regulator with XRE-family HTH domain
VASVSVAAHNVHMAQKNQPRHYLRAWRKFRGYTLEHVAEHVGMTHQNLGKIERGRVPYNETLLDILADFYRTDRGSLIMRDPSRPDPIWSIYDTLPAPKRVELERELAPTIERLKKTG